MSGKADDDYKDQFCDPEHPIVIQFQEVSAAAYKIKGGIERTPCTRSRISNLVGCDLYFKKEFLQTTGSFKERGARYTLMMLAPEQKKIGVVAASAGNHALALAYHGQDLNIPVTVVMPKIAPMMKVQNCKNYGAKVIIFGEDIGEAKSYCMKLCKEEGYVYVNGYDHPHILAGQGTMGLEIVEQVPDLDACIIPVGGGGLIAGTALAIKSLYPHVMIIVSLAVPLVGVNSYATAAPLIDKMVTVSEEFIALAILRLVEIEKAVVEGAGATGLAALLAGLLPELNGKKVVSPLCGGNIDTTVLGRCLDRGLAVDYRLVRFLVTVSDRPGGIAELARLLSSIGVSIKDMFHERAWLKSDIFSVQVKCVVETRDQEHCHELELLLRKHYKHIAFGPHVV
ncbi:hypothetical protein LSH36_25g05016 [Paralvinella palmiformis]|uniref:Serine racemase n=1 Tax=Paralvinella palmiformis TaxID=53620 RepID=A0AAD9KAP7_9ANNE|nr:hypothetical protein LSH36_25g05016 [Paralvinella palmiformis]